MCALLGFLITLYFPLNRLWRQAAGFVFYKLLTGCCCSIQVCPESEPTWSHCCSCTMFATFHLHLKSKTKHLETTVWLLHVTSSFLRSAPWNQRDRFPRTSVRLGFHTSYSHPHVDKLPPLIFTRIVHEHAANVFDIYSEFTLWGKLCSHTADGKWEAQ